MVFQLRRWLPDAALIVVADSSYSAIEFLHSCATLTKPVTVITRLRLDAALYEPAPPYSGTGRPRKKGKRLSTLQHIAQAEQTQWMQLSLLWYNQGMRAIEVVTGTAVWYHTGMPAVPIRWLLIRDRSGKFETQSLLSTDLDLTPEHILTFFMQRWQMEPTFQEVRTHLGVETQRQWSDKAIARTTPILLGLFSFVTVLAHSLFTQQHTAIRSAVWYPKTLPTFSDALAVVRHPLWADFTFQTSLHDPDMVKVPRALLERFNDLLCYAA